MRKLEIGSERFTTIYAFDEPGMGGASHEYNIIRKDSSDTVTSIKFQKGPVKESVANGCFNEDLIAIAIDRLRGFQSGDFPCRENALALTRLEEALHWLDQRTQDRQRRGVEGEFKE
jgi:hypothetical protein